MLSWPGNSWFSVWFCINFSAPTLAQLPHLLFHLISSNTRPLYLLAAIKNPPAAAFLIFFFFSLLKWTRSSVEKLWFLCLGEGGSAAGVMWLLIKRVGCLALCKSDGRNKAARVVKAPFLCLRSSLESRGNKHQPKAFTINHVCVWLLYMYPQQCTMDLKGQLGHESRCCKSVSQRQIKKVTSYLRPLLAYYY